MRFARTIIGVSLVAVAATTATALAATAAEPNQFTVHNGTLRPAKGVPTPASGTEASLWGDISYATTTLTGPGRITIGAIGSNCEGWPTVQVEVDGAVTGTATITSATDHGAYAVGTPTGPGTHQVTIRFINDHATATCDRNVHLGYARLDTTRPNASNTGVPAGTALRVHQGDLTISVDNTVIDGLDIRGFVRVKADNVTIRRTLIRGASTTVAKSLIQAWDPHTNLLVEDVTLDPDVPSPYLNGLAGNNFTARRMKITDVVDSVVVIGGEATVVDSYLYGNQHFDPDPNHPSGVSHDDNIQIEGGRNILIQNNVTEATFNAGVMVTQNYDRTADVRIIGNLMSGGGCTINLSERGKGPITDFLVQDNVFGPSLLDRCAVIAPPTSTPTMVNNVYLDGTTVTVRRGA